MTLNNKDWTSDLTPAKRSLLEWHLTDKIISNRKIQTIPKRKSFNNIPLSFSQERLWFINKLYPDSTAYNVITAFNLKGKLTEYALRKAFNAVVERHEILHTTFVSGNDGLVQLIKKENLNELKVIDLSGMPTENRDIKCEEIITQEAKCLFNLEQGPLFSCTLIKLENEEHILLLVNHHIISDAWSMAVFFQEISTYYEAIVKQTTPVLPELPIQYADYSIWQNEWMKSEELQHQLSYWKKQLQGAPPLIKLPIDNPRPAVQTFSGSVESIKLSSELTESLKIICRRENATLFMTLLATYVVFLFRYTNQEDISVGVPIAGRTKTETEKLIGPIINTLVIRISSLSNKTFKDLLNEVLQITLKAYENQDLPFQKLVEELQPTRNLSYTPIFQTMFNYRNIPDKPKQMNCVILEHYETKQATSLSDLTLDVTEKDDGLFVLFEYNTDLFRPDTIIRMIEHFQVLLEGILSNPEQLLSQLPLQTEAEQKQLLAWNQTESDYPIDQTIIDLFQAQVEKTPDNIAVVFEEQVLSYQKLNRAANQLAHYLISLGVGSETLVGICVERSLDMVIGLLGILKAGGAYVPFGPEYPISRLQFMLEDSSVTVLLSQSHLLERLPVSQENRAKVVCLDREREKIAAGSVENPVRQSEAENLAYVIYTSGSTGRPKGVMVEHQSLVNFIEAANAEYNITSSDRVLQFASISFDIIVEEIFISLTQGATLVLRTDEMISSEANFWKYCRDLNLTVVDLPTAYWHQLALAPLNIPDSLRIVIIGGEEVQAESVAMWVKQAPSTTRLFNTYGPTETTVVATICDLVKENTSSPIVSIGRSIGNLKVYILDRCLRPVPIGVSGELCIGGVGLARGYINRPDLTAEKFLDNPFVKDSNERLYKTGDMACYLSDGAIKFLGRIDSQVKIRGYRIELGEIEVVLGQHPRVKQVVVMAREDEPDNKRLVAYIVPEEDFKPSTSELSVFLKKKLPEYMIPSVFIKLDSLPLTPNGKVDRKALPVPDQKRPELNKEFTAPSTTTEIKLAEIFSGLLKLKEVGVNDNFFELGGHSLLAIQLLSRIAVTFQVDLPMRVVFESPFIAEISLKIEKIKEEIGKDEELGRLLDELEDLSDEEAQKRLKES
ncbi:MAG: amino acid adenylation domain-containing protein [Planctomycetes bacterium]|nr:amino acid adenylation domain-containing protein [Planctomycetota bacterium]